MKGRRIHSYDITSVSERELKYLVTLAAEGKSNSELEDSGREEDLEELDFRVGVWSALRELQNDGVV